MFLRGVQPLSETIAATHLPLQLATTGLVAVALSVLIVSSAGLYALMLVTVTQRRREIGIRMALGADRRHVLSGIFWRAALQVGGGIAIGLTIAMVAHRGDLKMDNFNGLVILPAVSIVMLIVGVLAALGRRGAVSRSSQAWCLSKTEGAILSPSGVLGPSCSSTAASPAASEVAATNVPYVWEERPTILISRTLLMASAVNRTTVFAAGLPEESRTRTRSAAERNAFAVSLAGWPVTG